MPKAGFYKGEPASPDTVKFKTDFQGIPVSVDRPKGFVMTGTDSSGKAWNRKYKVDYGFIPKTEGGDGDELDVFLGPNKKSTEAFWALQNKPDGSFDEYKLFLGFDTLAAARACYEAHIPAKMLKKMMPMKLDMLKALRGVIPTGLAKVASMLDEVQSIYAATADNPTRLFF